MATMNSSLKVPETIEGCLNLLRDMERGGLSLPSTNRDDWNKVRHQMTALCAARLRHICLIVEDVSKDELVCAPNCTSMEFRRYILFQKNNAKEIHPYDDTIRYQYLLLQNEIETASFSYINGEDDGYPEYGRITIPTEWLTCDDNSLREKVLSDMYRDLCQYVQKISKEIEDRINAKGKLIVALHQYLEFSEIE